MYGILVCGLKTLRVLLGSDEVPLLLLSVESLLMRMLSWYSLILILSMVFMKFMYICIWKSMRQINDELLVRIVILNAKESQALFCTIGSCFLKCDILFYGKMLQSRPIKMRAPILYLANRWMDLKML